MQASLRQRRPSESQRLQKAPSKRMAQGLRDAGRRATRVDEKMKRRMSARFAEISSPTDALVPDVPSLPIGIATSPSEISQKGSAVPSLTPREDPWVADLRLLDVDEFDPDTCASSINATYSGVDILARQTSRPRWRTQQRRS